MDDPAVVLTGDIRRAAFRRLLLTGSPTRADELALDLGRSVEEVARGVDELGARGRVRIDAEGMVTGAAGLSVVPDRHRIEIGGRTFWTWCAYDVVGIFGALQASGVAHSTSPSSGADIEVVSRYMACVSSSCGPAVLVDQAAKPIPALDPAGSHGDHVHRFVGPALREALVWPTLVIVLDELGQHRLQVPPTEDQQVVESLAPCCPTHLSANEFATGLR